MIEDQILEKAYDKAKKFVKQKTYNTFNETIRNDIDILIENIEQNKSLVSALVTSLVKKILDPKQDIRLHRTDFENGYSARVLDTKHISPFFKIHFPRYANKESSFLTLATRERIKWTKTEGLSLKIRNKNLKDSFLNVFDQIENYNAKAEDYLHYLFAKLILLSLNEVQSLLTLKKKKNNCKTININKILKMLHVHFNTKLSSRLPVIAIYSIYQILIDILKRYKDKELVPLQVHTSSDKHSFGDIEIYDKKNKPFEIIEIKHNIPIDKYMLFDILKKTDSVDINRYYILTTYHSVFENKDKENEVNDFIINIKLKKGIDIIANGIMTTLKYYLRFIDDYNEFIIKYSDNLIKESQTSTEVKVSHIKEWDKILNEYV